MALSDPQVVTIGGVANTLPRTSSGINSGSFTKDDSTVKLEIIHAYNKRNRHLVKLTTTKYAASPITSSTNVLRSMTVNLSVDVPLEGFTLAEQKDAVIGVLTLLSASSGATMQKVLGGEI